MIPLGPIVARARIRAPRAAVWAFVVESDRRESWWPDVKVDPVVGGSIVERWEDDGNARDTSGEIDVLVEGHALGFNWREGEDTRDTSVLVTLRTHGGETGVTVTESGFDALDRPAERAAAALEDWEALLPALVEAVEAAVADGFEAAVSVAPTPVAEVAEADPVEETEAPEESDPEEAEEPEAEEPAIEEPEPEELDVEEAADPEAEEPEAEVEEILAEEPEAEDSELEVTTVGTEIIAAEVVEEGELLEDEPDDDDEIVEVTDTVEVESVRAEITATGELSLEEVPLVLPGPPEEPDFDTILNGR